MNKEIYYGKRPYYLNKNNNLNKLKDKLEIKKQTPC